MIETERLFLRQFKLLDREPLSRLLGDAQVMRFGPGVMSAGEIDAWLHRCMDRYGREPGLLAVERRSDRALIGYCGLTRYPDVGGAPEVEVGYRCLPAYWGRGYATEAAAAVRDHAFARLGESRLISLIDPDNIRSVRVAEKIGMRFEKEVMMEGYTHPDAVYAMQRQD